MCKELLHTILKYKIMLLNKNMTAKGYYFPEFSISFVYYVVLTFSIANSSLYLIPGRLHYNHNQTFIHLLLCAESPNGKHAPAHHVPCSREPKASCVPSGPNACSSYDMILIDTSTREVSSQRAESQSRSTMTASPVPPSSLRNNAPSKKKHSISIHSCAFVSLSFRTRNGAGARASGISAVGLCRPFRQRELVYHAEAYCRRPRISRGERERRREGQIEE